MSRYIDDIAKDVVRWTAERCSSVRDSTAAELHAAFCAWHARHVKTYGAPSLRAFAMGLAAAGYRKRKSNGQLLYIGLSAT